MTNKTEDFVAGWNAALVEAAKVAEDPSRWRKHSGVRPDRDAIAIAVRELTLNLGETATDKQEG